jgi:CMP-N-acetylneuraminic acid synthetase
MKIFIPIKEQSQRVPKKNFRLFANMPLYKHTLYKLKDFEVYVDTDSEEIIKEVKKDKNLSHVTAYKRSSTLVDHNTSVCKLIKHFIVHEQQSVENDIICQIHVTSPFLGVATLTAAAKKFDEGYDSVTSCTPTQKRFWRKEEYGVCPVNHNPMILQQTQDLPVYYEENSLFYMFYSDIVLNSGNRIGKNPHFYPTSFLESLDIDTEDDWNFVNAIQGSAKTKKYRRFL